MRTDGNLGATPNYEPNRFGAFPQDASVNEPPLKVEGTIQRYNHRDDDDYFSHPRALYKLFDAAKRERLYGNIAAAMAGMSKEIVPRQLALFEKIDPGYAEGVKKALGKAPPVSETVLP
jgi:catalase